MFLFYWPLLAVHYIFLANKARHMCEEKRVPITASCPPMSNRRKSPRKLERDRNQIPGARALNSVNVVLNFCTDG